MLVSGESLDDAIEKAKNVKPEQFEKALTKSLSDGKTSPRYEQSQPQSKSEQTPKAETAKALKSSTLEQNKV